MSLFVYPFHKFSSDKRKYFILQYSQTNDTALVLVCLNTSVKTKRRRKLHMYVRDMAELFRKKIFFVDCQQRKSGCFPRELFMTVAIIVQARNSTDTVVKKIFACYHSEIYISIHIFICAQIFLVFTSSVLTVSFVCIFNDNSSNHIVW